MVSWAQGWQYPPEFQDHVHDVVIDVAHEPFGEIEHEHDYHSAHVLLFYQPTHFHEDPYWRDMINAVGKELDVLHATLDQLLMASFPKYSPTWALRRWEELTGNPVSPSGVSLADRRAAVLAKMVRGPRTVDDFKQLINRWFGVEGQVIERFDVTSTGSTETRVDVYNVEDEWTVPDTVDEATFECWGGGGGGGQGGTTFGAPAGGGAAYTRKTQSVTPGQVYSLEPGRPGDPIGTPGDHEGGISYVRHEGAVVLSANPGRYSDNGTGGSGEDVTFGGGSPGEADGTRGGGGGGAGGTDGDGENGSWATGTDPGGGGAGGTDGGDGGAGGGTDQPGVDGATPGGGGGGGGSNFLGGSGGTGQVRVTYEVDTVVTTPLLEVEFNVYGSPTNAERRAFERIVRAYLPAHLDMSVNYGGFIVGVNRVGDEV